MCQKWFELWGAKFTFNPHWGYPQLLCGYPQCGIALWISTMQIMDIHNCIVIVDIRNYIVDIQNATVDIHNVIVDIRNVD
jgi:hypothetical protein